MNNNLTKSTLNTCFVYTRVSTEEQGSEGFSLENQKRACIDYAKNKGFHIRRIFIDDGKSGRTSDRPALKEMLKVLKERPVASIVIYKIDRFYRNVSEFSRILDDFKKRGINLISVNEGDLMANGSLIPNILASVAQWESEINGERTKDALTQKFREGWQPTPPPIGYMSVGGPRERKTQAPDPNVAPIIKELFQLYATGNYSIYQVEKWLASKNIISKNGTILGHSVIHTILNNPFYYGLIRWNGQSKMGKHKPIITKELFDTCQYVLAKHRNFLIRNRTHNFLLRGFAYCGECDQRYTAEWHKVNSPRMDKIAYYHCPKYGRNGCPSPYIEKGKLEKQAEAEMRKMQFSEDFINLVVKKTKEYLANTRKNSEGDRQAVLNQKSALEVKRNKLEDNLLDGIIDKEVFKRKHAELQEKIDNLEEELQEIENRSQIDTNLIEEVLALTRNIHKTYKEAPPFLKRHYLRFFFEKLVVKNKVICQVVPTPIFASLQENHSVIIRATQLPGLDSNQEPIA